MSKLKTISLLSITVFLWSCGNTETKPLVLTSVGPVYSLTSSLLAGTSVEVTNIPAEAEVLALADQPTWFTQSSASQGETYKKAGVVVSMTNIWQEDPLYQSVRATNDSIAHIDSSTFSSSTVIAESTGQVSPYFWLSTSRVDESSKIIADKLAELFPNEAEQIKANQKVLSAQLSSAASNFEQVKTEHDLKAFGLSDIFAYMTNDLDIPVTGYFIKADADWNIDDHGNLIKNTYDQGQPVVIHHRDPDNEIGLSLTISGSKLVVLDAYETSTDDIVTIATGNLDRLTTALTTPQRRGGGQGGGRGDQGGGERNGGGR